MKLNCCIINQFYHSPVIIGELLDDCYFTDRSLWISYLRSLLQRKRDSRAAASILVSCNSELYHIMASAVHAPSPSYPPPPAYSQTTTDAVVNGVNRSHSAFNSFDGAPSVASTPTPTPPASRHQQIMPHGMPSYSQSNGTYSQQTTPRHHHELKPMIQQQHYPPGQRPQIYTV